MRTITIEEHFATSLFLTGPGSSISQYPEISEKLLDLGERRIAEMDSAGIDMQVLSITPPGVEQSPVAEAITLSKEINDKLALAIAAFPDRFSGFAAIPTADPKAAVAELERAVGSLGFRGAIINGHVNGRYLDDEYFWPIFESAQSLDVPIYLHPTKPPKAISDIYYSGFSPVVDEFFASAGFGWHIETGVHVMRLILGGVFDRFPDLQIIIGHLGESLPFMQQRMNRMFTTERTGLKRPISAYLKENIHYTIGGFNYEAPFRNLFLEVGAERILFSADYPWATMANAKDFLEALPVNDSERQMIAYQNAEALLKI
ncbi:MAG: amidohydrolase [Mucilaginibacter sp.]|nr:amidohydrolase [Mucilaginibacter sp.]